MDTQQRCPECGRPVGPNALDGLCPKCMIKVGLAAQSQVSGQGPLPDPEKGRFVPPVPSDLAQGFPHLEILELIGQGGMGAVYKARQPALDRLVALKILRPEAGADPAFAERFTREAKALARLSHPNIVAVHDFGESAGFYYFVMEFVDGLNLRQMLSAQRLAPKEAMAIVPQICEALQYAHDQGIVHRDIKPENILLDRQGHVKIADFGLAKLLGQEPGDHRLTVSNAVMGTPHYMAPEQVEHPMDVDHRADIYSLGVVFYEMLTGELPLGRFAPPSRKVQIDVRLDEVVLRALEKEPQLRYQQVSQVKTEVETIAETPPSSSRREEAQAAKSDIRNRQSEIPSRFSRVAIVGVLLTVFSLSDFIKVVLVMSKSHPERYSHASEWLVIFLGQDYLLAAVGTTILGWIAVSQIRRSAGKLYGLWLAVFDGVLFPLLVLDAVVVKVLVGFARVFAEFYSNFSNLNNPQVHAPFATRLANLFSQHDEIAPLVAALIVIVVDFLIIRRVWRAVKVRSNSSTATPSKTSVSQPAATPVRDAAATRRRRRVGAALAVAALLALTLIALPAIHQLMGYARGDATRPQGSTLVDGTTGYIRCGATLRELGVVELSLAQTHGFTHVNSKSRDLGNTAATNQSSEGNWLLPDGKTLRIESTWEKGLGLRVRVKVEPGGLYSQEDITIELARQLGLLPKAASPLPLISKATALSQGQPAFSPEIEVTLHDCDVQPEALDFETGRILAVPAETEKQLQAGNPDWFVNTCVDLMMDTTRKGFGLITMLGNELQLVKLANEEWDSLTPAQLSEALSRGVSGLTEDLAKQFGKVYVLQTDTPLPLTLGFRTGGGTEGMLQLTRFGEGSQPPVTLRYKLVAELYAFGPVIERVVNSPEAGTHAAALNLESGELHDLPVAWPKLAQNLNDALPTLERLMASPQGSGIHLIGGGAGSNSVILLNSVAGPVSNEEFDTLTPLAVVASAYVKNNAISDPSSIVAHQGGPLTVLVRTRAGRYGLLQITGFTDNPRGVKIRYKLVRNPNVTAASPPDTAAVFGLKAERILAADKANRDGVVGYRFKNNEEVAVPEALTGHFRDLSKRGFTPELKQWMRDNRVDVVFHFAEKFYDVLTLDMRDGFIAQGKEWDTVLPAQAVPAMKKLEAMNTEPGSGISGGAGYRDGPTSVNVFRTREGIVGYWQLRAFSDVDGRGVVIRYKLVQSSPIIPQDAAIQAILDYGGFVKTNSAGRVFLISLVYDEDEQGNRRECAGTSDAIARWLPAFPELEELLLAGSQATDQAMEFVGQLHRLKELWMWNAQVSDEGVAKLKDLKDLRVLHINDAGIGDRSLAVLAELPRLEKLSLQGNDFTDAGLAELKGMTQLKELWIGLGTERFTGAGLASLSNLVNLEVLELGTAPIGEEALKPLHRLTKLRQLIGRGRTLNQIEFRR